METHQKTSLSGNELNPVIKRQKLLDWLKSKAQLDTVYKKYTLTKYTDKLQMKRYATEILIIGKDKVSTK